MWHRAQIHLILGLGFLIWIECKWPLHPQSHPRNPPCRAQLDLVILIRDSYQLSSLELALKIAIFFLIVVWCGFFLYSSLIQYPVGMMVERHKQTIPGASAKPRKYLLRHNTVRRHRGRHVIVYCCLSTFAPPVCCMRLLYRKKPHQSRFYYD